MFIPLWVIIALGVYIFGNFFFSLKIYKEYNKYITPLLRYDDKTGRIINLHDLYPDFHMTDKVSLHRIFLGLVFFVWWKLFFALMFTIGLSLFLRFVDCFGSKEKFSSTKRFFIYYLTKFHLRFINFFLGINFIIRYPNGNDEAIYKKYLGSAYDINEEKKFSLIIMNHVSWMEIFLLLYKLVPGFVSKSEVLKIPFIGVIAQKIGSIFLDRDSQHDRKKTSETIKKRQQQFMSGEITSPLIIFPEGTLTNGKCLLKFKRGAFDSYLPVKPYLLKNNNSKEYFSTCSGSMNVGLHLIISLCHIYNDLELYDLPVIEPTEYMIEKYSTQDCNDKVEVYMEVTRSIMSEIANLEKSNKGYKEHYDYYYEIIGHKPSNENKTKFE